MSYLLIFIVIQIVQINCRRIDLSGLDRHGRQFELNFEEETGNVFNFNCNAADTCTGLAEILKGQRKRPQSPTFPQLTPTFPQSSPSSNGSGNIQCQTTCQSNGSCKVKIINGPPGPLSGSCFPPDFGGSCTGIPTQCQRGSNIQQQCGSPCQAGTRNA